GIIGAETRIMVAAETGLKAVWPGIQQIPDEIAIVVACGIIEIRGRGYSFFQPLIKQREDALRQVKVVLPGVLALLCFEKGATEFKCICRLIYSFSQPQGRTPVGSELVVAGK